MRVYIANRLKELDWSLAELSRASGVPYPTLRDVMKKDRADPQFSTIIKIAEGLNVSPGRLLENPEYAPDSVRRKLTPKEALEILREEIEKPPLPAVLVSRLPGLLRLIENPSTRARLDELLHSLDRKSLAKPGSDTKKPVG